MKAKHAEILVVLLLSLGAVAAPSIHSARAAGQLYVSPTSVPVQAVGSTFSVMVKVASMDQFNGWEVQVAFDPSVINATSLTVAGNVFQANTTGGLAFETRNCVNGGGSGCCLTNACAPLDGVGKADSSYADTKFASGNGLLFTVNFQVVSAMPFSPISIQNDVISNGGRTGVAHTTVNGSYGQLITTSISVSKFFTDGNFSPLTSDNQSGPSLTVVLANGVVKSTNPGQILAWVNLTNTGQTSLLSASLTDTLPVDWVVHPPWPPSTDGVHVYYANTANLVTNLDITNSTTVSVSAGNPQTVALTISNFTQTTVGHALSPGQSILLSVQLQYGLKMTSQSFASYPRTYTDTASASAWTNPSQTGSQANAVGSASFTAHAKVLGDVNADGQVDILDVGAVLAAFGSTPGTLNWNPNADFGNNGYIGITDVSLVFYYFGTSS